MINTILNSLKTKLGSIPGVSVYLYENWVNKKISMPFIAISLDAINPYQIDSNTNSRVEYAIKIMACHKTLTEATDLVESIIFKINGSHLSIANTEEVQFKGANRSYIEQFEENAIFDCNILIRALIGNNQTYPDAIFKKLKTEPRIATIS